MRENPGRLFHQTSLYDWQLSRKTVVIYASLLLSALSFQPHQTLFFRTIRCLWRTTHSVMHHHLTELVQTANKVHSFHYLCSTRMSRRNWISLAGFFEFWNAVPFSIQYYQIDNDFLRISIKQHLQITQKRNGSSPMDFCGISLAENLSDKNQTFWTPVFRQRPLSRKQQFPLLTVNH